MWVFSKGDPKVCVGVGESWVDGWVGVVKSLMSCEIRVVCKKISMSFSVLWKVHRSGTVLSFFLGVYFFARTLTSYIFPVMSHSPNFAEYRNDTALSA